MGVTLSKEYGVNPSVTRCICCGKEYGVTLFGTAYKDKEGKTAEAPREVYQGLCDSCQSVIDKGGIIFIEVKDGESGNNPYRTGRIIGLNKDFRERNNIPHQIAYMVHSEFEQLFGEHLPKH